MRSFCYVDVSRECHLSRASSIFAVLPARNTTTIKSCFSFQMETSCTSLTWRITTRKRWTKMTKRTRNASSTPSRKRWRSSATHIMTNTKNTRKGVSVCHRLYICRCCLWKQKQRRIKSASNQPTERSFFQFVVCLILLKTEVATKKSRFVFSWIFDIAQQT